MRLDYLDAQDGRHSANQSLLGCAPSVKDLAILDTLYVAFAGRLMFLQNTRLPCPDCLVPLRRRPRFRFPRRQGIHYLGRRISLVPRVETFGVSQCSHLALASLALGSK